jgi:uncharacterized protein
MQPDYILFDEIDKDGPQQRSRTYDIPASELERFEVAALAPVSIDVDVRKGELPGQYIADGSVRFTADLTCARCLDAYPFANDSTFHLRFAPRPERLTEETDEVELTSEDELDTEFYTERQIPLRDLAIEQIQLTIPMKPLCDDRCLGLCPQCGKNGNREGCQCETVVTDERWGALKDFKAELLKKKES